MAGRRGGGRRPGGLQRPVLPQDPPQGSALQVVHDDGQILAVDLYDRNGELVGLQEAHPISYYDVPMFLSTLETIYDFKGNRYFVDGLDNNEPMYDFNVQLKKSDFTAAALRREGI